MPLIVVKSPIIKSYKTFAKRQIFCRMKRVFLFVNRNELQEKTNVSIVSEKTSWIF